MVWPGAGMPTAISNISRGKYFPDQSFFGHGVEASVSIYHLINPGQKIPLNWIVRLKEHYSVYATDDTAANLPCPTIIPQ